MDDYRRKPAKVKWILKWSKLGLFENLTTPANKYQIEIQVISKRKTFNTFSKHYDVAGSNLNSYSSF